MSTSFAASDPNALGRRLRRARDRAGVSMALAARRVNMTPRDLGRLERGRAETTLETLDTLARLYRCPIAHLATGTGPATVDELYAVAGGVPA